jgi:hypothetical protein
MSFTAPVGSDHKFYTDFNGNMVCELPMIDTIEKVIVVISKKTKATEAYILRDAGTRERKNIIMPTTLSHLDDLEDCKATFANVYGRVDSLHGGCVRLVAQQPALSGSKAQLGDVSLSEINVEKEDKAT